MMEYIPRGVITVQLSPEDVHLLTVLVNMHRKKIYFGSLTGEVTADKATVKAALQHCLDLEHKLTATGTPQADKSV